MKQALPGEQARDYKIPECFDQQLLTQFFGQDSDDAFFDPAVVDMVSGLCFSMERYVRRLIQAMRFDMAATTLYRQLPLTANQRKYQESGQLRFKVIDKELALEEAKKQGYGSERLKEYEPDF